MNEWMQSVHLWQQKITVFGVREGERESESATENSEMFVLYYFCFLYRSDTMYVDDCKHIQAHVSWSCVLWCYV